MKFLTRSLLLSTLVAFMNSCYYTETADILIHNAKIYSVDASFTIYEAMAIKDGKIIDLGPNNELKNRYESKKIIDAQLKPIYPGFIDAHCHFLWYGNTFNEVNLVGTKSWEEALERIKAFESKNENKWIIGRGWDQNDWENKEFPNNEKLNELFPDKPVFLTRIDFHAAIANQTALNLANITTESVIEGGIFQKINGKLDGILIDKAISVISKAIPKLNKAQMKKALLKAQEMCFAKGLTTVDDAMLENEMVHIIDSLQQSGELKMNIYGMLVPSDENKREFLENGPYLTEKLSIRSFKYFADGALGSRGAKLLSPYHDDASNSGLTLVDSVYFLEEAKALYNNGFQMNTHCIGDGANRMVLDIYGQVLQGTNDRRWRVEHAQVLDESDFYKFQQFTIIPSVQPTHATSDYPWALDRLGEKRLKHSYAYKKLLSMNGILPLGTDFPIEDIDPLKTFYAATIRKNISGKPNDGFQMNNALDREDALKGMTIWAAISNFEENTKGSLEIGKKADFIILNQDILKIKEQEILNTKVEATYLDGEEVFKQ
ncbi:MAG: amidohydrolase [Flavobacteriales bacterium]|nr:amidohydrolase [Flavobacteriales bacterium]